MLENNSLQIVGTLDRADSGSVVYDGVDVLALKERDAARFRNSNIGFVFQFPEAQLFEETVLKDIAFAPKNFGATEQEAEKIAREKPNSSI